MIEKIRSYNRSIAKKIVKTAFKKKSNARVNCSGLIGITIVRAMSILTNNNKI